jgi:ABC-type phosphate/phosphonate transport system permease subunit
MDPNTKAGFFGGIFLSSIVHIGVEDFITTIILAIVGTIVSFIVSVILKYFYQKLKEKKGK